MVNDWTMSTNTGQTSTLSKSKSEYKIARKKAKKRKIYSTYIKTMIFIYPIPLAITRVVILYLPKIFCNYRKPDENFRLTKVICSPIQPENIINNPVHVAILVPLVIFILHASVRFSYYLCKFCRFWPQFCRAWGTGEEGEVCESELEFCEVVVVIFVFWTYFLLILSEVVFRI